MWLLWNLVSVHSETVLVLEHYSYTVCAECTMGSKIILDTPDGLLGNMGHGESCFSTFGDGVSVGGR
jgi:hypothetical protein